MAIARAIMMPRLTVATALTILAVLSLPIASFGEDRVVLSDSIKPLPVVAAAREALSDADKASTLEFMISLKMRNFAALQAQIAKGEIVSPAEMTAKYYPLAADYKIVSDWLTSQGFTITSTDPNRLGIFASGRVDKIQQALQVSFAKVAANGTTYISAATAPSLPASVAAPVIGVNGLQPHLQKHVHSRFALAQKQPLASNAPPFFPSEILKAYNADALNVTGAGQQIGIVIDTPPKTTDLTQFWNLTGVSQSLSNISFIQVIAGPNPTPSGEESLDTEWSSSIAPGAKVRVYVTRTLADLSLDKAYQQIIADFPNTPGLNQISLSFGANERSTSGSQMNTDAQYFASMAGSGITVFASTGDNGSKPSGVPDISSPSNDPSVTGVGGTSLFLSESSGSVVSESVWSGSGGGVSRFFSRPAFQTGPGVPAGAFRLNPDISSAADPNTGSLVVLNGHQQQIGGTSWSSPTWAGFCALINEARAKASLPSAGLLGPKIYPLIGTPSFRDITMGSNGTNGMFNATPGFDLCTGIGVPHIANLINALTNGGTPPNLPTITGFLPASGPVGTTVTITGTNFIGPMTVTFNGVAAQGVFNGSQAVYQVPAGATTGPIGITTPNGSATTSINFTVTAGDVSSQPNLTPFAPAGWSDEIVVSTMAGSTLDNRLTATDTLFVSFALVNIGTVDINSTVDVELDIDGVATSMNPMTTNPFTANGVQTQLSINIGSLPLGPHTIAIIIDPANVVAETNENDNTYTKNIVVKPPLPNATIVATGTADANAATDSTLMVELSSPQNADVIVTFSMSGTAVLGIDYTLSSHIAIVPAGQTKAAVLVTALFDSLSSADLSAIATLTASTEYIAGTPSDATVTIKNVPPPLVIASLPVANPNPAMAGQIVAFSELVSTVTNNQVAYEWDFGDGSTTLGSNVGHAYSVPGTFNVTVTATDGNLTSQNGLVVTVIALPMQVSSLALKFLFKSKRDSLVVNGSLPIGTGYTPNGDSVIVTLGSATFVFQLSSRGKGQGFGASFTLKGKMKNFVFTDAVLKYQLKLANQDLFNVLNPSPGFSQFTSQSGVVFPILVQFPNSTFIATPTVNYVTNGQAGSAK